MKLSYKSAGWVWWVVRISGGWISWMDFLEDLWILLLLPPLSPPLSLYTHTLQCIVTFAGTQNMRKVQKIFRE